jgi:hypothetical protein
MAVQRIAGFALRDAFNRRRKPMTHLLSKRRTILLLILLPLLVSLACSFLTGGPAAGTQTPDSQTPGSATIQADVVFGPGAFIFPDTKAGLADLSSYKATLTLSFDGARDGKAEQWSKTYVMLTTKEPAKRQLTLEKTGNLSDLNQVFMAESDGAAYERNGENACTANVIDPENSLAKQLEPAGFLNGVIGAEDAGAESVNDVAANHYTFDERAFGQLGLAKSTGEIWVASEGGYIVKYLVTTKGNADYFGKGIEGTLTWDYELTDVNQTVTFALPADCPAGMINAPLLPDASNVLKMPSVLTYDTASSLADAAAFYQKQIPDLGWALTGEPAITDTTALLSFTQGDQQMSVIVSTGDTGTVVHIVIVR